MDTEADKYDVVTGLDTLGPTTAALAANFFPSRTDFAGGVRADTVLTIQRGLEVTPGVRLDFFGSQGTTAVAVDPRLAARLAMTHRSHLLWAMGLAHQPPSFTIPVPGFQPGGLSGGLQTAAQESLGVEWELGSATATATVFHNGFFNMSDALGVMQPRPRGACPAPSPATRSPATPAPSRRARGPAPIASRPERSGTISFVAEWLNATLSKEEVGTSSLFASTICGRRSARGRVASARATRGSANAPGTSPRAT